jgi:DNA-binding transcriptional LysR family regulator
MDGAHMEQITAFLAVLEAGSFVKASALLNKDVSTISRRVSALEERLGVRLLERSTRRLNATEAGSLLYERMHMATAAMEDAEAEVAQTGGVVTGRLRLALPATFGRRCIVPMLPDFLTAYPNVSIEAEFSDRYVDLISERFDVAIRIGELHDSRLVSRKLAVNERVLCAAPSYLAAHGVPATPEALSEHACLANQRFSGFPEWRFRKGSAVASVRVKGRFIADDPDSLISAALAGMGIVVCAKWLTVTERAQGRLVPILADWTFEREGGIHLIMPSARFTAGKTRGFVDWIAARFKEPNWG